MSPVSEAGKSSFIHTGNSPSRRGTGSPRTQSVTPPCGVAAPVLTLSVGGEDPAPCWPLPTVLPGLLAAQRCMMEVAGSLARLGGRRDWSSPGPPRTPSGLETRAFSGSRIFHFPIPKGRSAKKGGESGGRVTSPASAGVRSVTPALEQEPAGGGLDQNRALCLCREGHQPSEAPSLKTGLPDCCFSCGDPDHAAQRQRRDGMALGRQGPGPCWQRTPLAKSWRESLPLSQARAGAGQQQAAQATHLLPSPLQSEQNTRVPISHSVEGGHPHSVLRQTVNGPWDCLCHRTAAPRDSDATLRSSPSTHCVS